MAISITDYEGFRMEGDKQVGKFTEQYNCSVRRTENKTFHTDAHWMYNPRYAFGDDLALKQTERMMAAQEYEIRISVPDLLRLMAGTIREKPELSTVDMPSHSHYPPHSHYHVYSDNRLIEIEQRYGWTDKPNASFVILDLINESREKKEAQAKEEEIRNKNAAVKIAWDHYQLLLAMCKDD